MSVIYISNIDDYVIRKNENGSMIFIPKTKYHFNEKQEEIEKIDNIKVEDVDVGVGVENINDYETTENRKRKLNEEFNLETEKETPTTTTHLTTQLTNTNKKRINKKIPTYNLPSLKYSKLLTYYIINKNNGNNENILSLGYETGLTSQEQESNKKGMSFINVLVLLWIDILKTHTKDDIIKNTTFHIVEEPKNNNGFKYCQQLGFSYQRKNANSTFKEIIYMVSVFEYSCYFKILKEDNTIYTYLS